MWKNIELNNMVHEGTKNGYEFIGRCIEGFGDSEESWNNADLLVTVRGYLKETKIVFEVIYEMEEIKDDERVIKSIQEAKEYITTRLEKELKLIKSGFARMDAKLQESREGYEFNKSDYPEISIELSSAEKDLKVNISGYKERFDDSNLLVAAASEIIGEIEIDNFSPIEKVDKIFTSFCEMLRHNFDLPEEWSHKDIMNYYLENKLV